MIKHHLLLFHPTTGPVIQRTSMKNEDHSEAYRKYLEDNDLPYLDTTAFYLMVDDQCDVAAKEVFLLPEHRED